MTEVDRPVEDTVDRMGRMQRELDDLRATLLARVARRAVGDVEPTIRKTPKDNTLLLQGQTVSRTTYAVLWKWVSDQDLVTAGLFTSGDGSTTFGLPDFRGRVAVGADAVNTLGALFGTATLDDVPIHTHRINGEVWGVGNHDHAIAGTGGHGGHWDGGTQNPGYQVNNLASPYVNPGADLTANYGHHSHAMDWNGAHTHGMDFGSGTAGSGDPVDNHPPSIAVNWLIWT